MAYTVLYMITYLKLVIVFLDKQRDIYSIITWSDRISHLNYSFMALLGSHQFGEINGQRVTFVEKKVAKERAGFLSALLTLNKFEVLVTEDERKSEEEPQLYTVAVTDMVFNPTIWVFERRLKTFDGRKVTQAYWNQDSDETNPRYWNL